MLRSDPSATEPDLAWPDLPASLSRVEGEVLVVAASLQCDTARERRVKSWISPEEQDRARAFSHPELRRRFIASRGVLREVLAQRVGVEPAALVFAAGSHGKPALHGHDGLQFNLAHSADLMLLAVGTSGELGVDIEAIRPMPEVVALTRRFFTGREAAWLESRPATERDVEFFRLWTRKEAVLKACGLGIANGLDRVELIGDDGAWCRRVIVPESPSIQWVIEELVPARGYLGAVAVPGEHLRLRCHSWRGEP